MSEPRSTATTEKATADARAGSVKEAIGRLIGDAKVEVEGRAQQSPSARQTAPKSTSPKSKSPKSDVTPKAMPEP